MSIETKGKGEEKYIILNARGVKIQITPDIGHKISGKLGNFMKQYKEKVWKEEIFIKYSEDTVHQILDEINDETFKQFIRLKPNPKARNANIFTVIKQPNKVLLDKSQINIKILKINKKTKQFELQNNGYTSYHYDLLIKIGNVSKIWNIIYIDTRSGQKRSVNIAVKYPVYPNLNANGNYLFDDPKQVVFDEEIIHRYVYTMLTSSPNILSQFYDLN